MEDIKKSCETCAVHLNSPICKIKQKRNYCGYWTDHLYECAHCHTKLFPMGFYYQYDSESDKVFLVCANCAQK